MASVCLSTTPTWKPSSLRPPTQKHVSFHTATSFSSSPRMLQAVTCYMYRHPLDTPIEFELPRAPCRPDVFRQLTPLRAPLPTPLPYDPREEDEFAEEGEIEERMKQPEPENRAHDYDE